MSKLLPFTDVWKRHFKTLEQYVPVVARVHGGSHPEFHEVHKLFDTIAMKVKNAGPEALVLSEEFAKLRKITKDYTVPEDVCGTYQEVYKMLSQIDEAYQA